MNAALLLPISSKSIMSAPTIGPDGVIFLWFFRSFCRRSIKYALCQYSSKSTMLGEFFCFSKCDLTCVRFLAAK